ncbi:MAG TPA: DUF3800 domain-containing protein [Edaphobacter sp.]|nr:DUF3800 domain-containing protein [Edaphobacter sp.]
MLTAYVDESGQEQDDWMFVAGYIGDDAAWKRFAPEWRKAIAPRENLHLNTFRFKKERERRTLERAGTVPKLCGLTPIVAGVRTRDYQDLITGTRAEKLLNGYVMCVYALIIQALRGIPADERLEVVFERQDVYGDKASAAMRAIVNTKIPELLTTDGTHKLADWQFVPKQKTILTQPADYLAYALLQKWRNSDPIKVSWCDPILAAHGHEGLGKIMDKSIIRQVVHMTAMLLKVQHAPDLPEGLRG